MDGKTKLFGGPQVNPPPQVYAWDTLARIRTTKGEETFMLDTS